MVYQSKNRHQVDILQNFILTILTFKVECCFQLTAKDKARVKVVEMDKDTVIDHIEQRQLVWNGHMRKVEEW